jgi:hypothetical protein
LSESQKQKVEKLINYCLLEGILPQGKDRFDYYSEIGSCSYGVANPNSRSRAPFYCIAKDIVTTAARLGSIPTEHADSERVCKVAEANF